MFLPSEFFHLVLPPRSSIRPLSSSARLVLYLLIGSLLITGPDKRSAFGQSPGQDDDVLRVTTDLLLFPIRIRDKRGNAPNELTERKLELKDNDRATSSLVLSRGAERIALIFALDQSGSLRSIISQQREAAAALFGRFSDRSRMAVLRFAETPTLVAPFGRDADAIRAAFNFSVGNQHTAIFDGAAAAIDSINELPVDRAERRIVVLISDGLDNASRTKAIQVIDKAVEKHISFYVIHLPLFEPIDDRLAVRKPTKGFRELAEKTGGKYFLAVGANAALAPPKNLDLTQVFQAIEEDLKSQYLLGFYISETGRDGRRHEFSVSLPEGLEYSVGKRGYARKHRFFVHMKPADTTTH